MKKTIVLLALILMVVSCKEQIAYKYQDKPQEVTCQGADKALMHEALYSFQDDINEYFKDKGTGNKDLVKAYAKYVYMGTMGNLPFATISSRHTRAILDKLKSQPNLFVKKDGKTILNFENPYVICLVDNIKNKEVQRILKGLMLVKDMRPELVSEPYRIHVRDVHIDQNFAMLIALQTYYANLADIDFSQVEKQANTGVKELKTK
jgi:hypothetical protein